VRTVFEDLERELVSQALARVGVNQTRAGALLGMTRDQIRCRVGIDLQDEAVEDDRP
jgi:DNA-binding protein Fis